MHLRHGWRKSKSTKYLDQTNNHRSKEGEVMLILKILKGDPTAQDWAEIGEMIEEGFKVGIDRPSGINWDLEWKPSSNTK